MMIGFFEGLPGRIGGSRAGGWRNIWQAFAHVAMPLARPGIMVAMILAFISVWNNFIFGVVLAGRTTRTLPVAVYNVLTFEQIVLGTAGRRRAGRDRASAAADLADAEGNRGRIDRRRRQGRLTPSDLPDHGRHTRKSFRFDFVQRSMNIQRCPVRYHPWTDRAVRCSGGTHAPVCRTYVPRRRRPYFYTESGARGNNGESCGSRSRRWRHACRRHRQAEGKYFAAGGSSSSFSSSASSTTSTRARSRSRLPIDEGAGPDRCRYRSDGSRLLVDIRIVGYGSGCFSLPQRGHKQSFCA